MTEPRALLQTDIVESTRRQEQLGDAAMSAVWTAYERVSRDVLRRWRGREIDKSDGFLLMFADVADAVGFALDYHRALAALNTPLLARVGVHVGPVTLRENPAADVGLGAKPLELDGLAKPLTARVMSLARGGQTLLTAAARAALGPTATRLVSHGHWRMRGLAEPIELFEIGAPDAPFTPPSEADKVYRVVRRDDLWLPLRELRHSLPAERDSFIGRQAALQDLAGRCDDGARLISVLGMGGSGKTRLAQRFAWTWLGDFAGGAWFCDLSQARDVDGIVQAVAEGLDVPLGRSDPVAQLGSALAARGHCLVILDNFEQVARWAEPTLGRWLEGAREACFLVTSREPLHIAGEQSLLLAPLAPQEAAALFRQRAAATGHPVGAGAEDDAAVDDLVGLLDGSPLAIELAAARSRVMTPRMLRQRMTERFKLLTSTGGRHDRQATLRATFDWSWDLLSPAERAALAQLSVFEGPVRLDAIEATLDLSACADAPVALDALQSLVEKSFVRASADRRFDMLGAVREYAAENLATPGRFPASGPAALAATQARHCEFFATLGAAGAVADGCANLDDLIAAVRHAARISNGRAAVAALEGAGTALRLRGPFSVGVALAELVRAMPGLDGGSMARVDRMAGWLLKAGGRAVEARVRLEAALTGARLAGDGDCEGRVMAHLGDAYMDEGHVGEGRAVLTAALAHAREHHDLILECEVLCGLGNLDEHTGRLDEAIERFQSALAVARQAGDRRWEGGILGNLGVACDGQGRTADARVHYAAALSVARELGERQWEGNTLCNLGLMLHGLGQMDEARATLDAALKVARELEHRRLECIVVCNLGLVVEALQQPELAQAHYESALRIARELADRRSEGQVLGHLGLLHARRGRFDAARDYLHAGEQQLLEVSDRLNLGLLLCNLVECEHRAGAAAAARNALAGAAAIAEQLGCGPESELRLNLAQMGDLLAAQAPIS